MDIMCPSNDVPVPDIIDSGGSKVNHPSNDVPVPDNHDVIDVPDLHDVIDGDKPNLVMWLNQMAQLGGSARWLIHWLNQMAQPVARLDG
jgi:hypothetical protein